MNAQAVSQLAVGIVSQLHASRMGRVKVKFPHLDGTESDWCAVVTPMGGPDRGLVLLPEVGDHVLVGFEHGDPLRGLILGAIWSQQQPAPAGDGHPRDNNLRFIRSRSGHVVRLDDTPGQEQIEIVDGSGKRRIVLDTASDKLSVTAESGDVAVSAPAGKVAVEATEVTIKTAGTTVSAQEGKVAVEATEVTIKAGGTINIEASGTLTLKGATVNIN